MEIRLDGRHALVCGASSGIGRAAAVAIASLGAEVTVLARSEGRLEALLPELRAAGAPEARALVADLDDRQATGPRIERLLADHGPVHVLVNNTGGPPSGPLLGATEDDFLRAFGRHLFAAHALVKATLPGMAAAGYGRIINVTSTSVREPIPMLGVSNTTRAAMAAWAKTLSNELPPGVTINTVLPGSTATGRLDALADGVAAARGSTRQDVLAEWASAAPEGRLGRPDELGAVIAFLASPASSFVRGVVIPVDGGRTRSI